MDLKTLVVIFFIGLTSQIVVGDDFDMGFTDEELFRMDAELNGKIVICDGSGFKAVDNPLAGLEDGNLLKCLAPQNNGIFLGDNIADQNKAKRVGIAGKFKNILSGDFSYKKVYEGADCNCYPKNKLDEFLLQDYGKDGFDKKFKDIKNKTKTAYISNMRGTFQDMIDFEIFLSQNKIDPDDRLLVELKNCNINQYKKNIGIKIEDLCGLNPKEADSTISKILPDFLDKKIESIIKNEKIENSCLDYKTYKNATQASEYRTLFTILNSRARNLIDIASIMQTSLNAATEEEHNGVEFGMSDLQTGLRNSFVTRYFLFNKDKFINDERFIKYGETTIPSDKELLEFANDVKSVILKDANIKAMAENIGRKCENGIKDEVIETAFCPKESKIPNSIYENLEKSNIVKIKKYCSQEDDSSNEMGEDVGQQTTVSNVVENFFDAKKNLFSSEKLFKKATAPKKAIIKALCGESEAPELDIAKKREEAIWENFAFLNISYGICFKSQDECEKHGYRPKYSNDPTTLEDFCKVTTERFCETQLRSVKMYIANDPKLNKSDKKIYDAALEIYRNKASPRLVGVVAGIKTNDIGISAFDLQDIETSIKMLDSDPVLDMNIQKIPINVQTLSQDSKPSAIADYAVRGSEEDFDRIVKYENDVKVGKVSDGPLYERKIPVPVVESKVTNTTPIAPQTTSVANENLVTEPSTIQEQDRVVENTKISPAPKAKSSPGVVASSLPIPEISSTIHTSEEKSIRDIETRSSNDKPPRNVTSSNDDSSEVKKLESSIDEIKKLQEQLEREEMDKMSSSPSSSATQSRIEESRRRIEELSRETNEVASRAIESANSASREIDRASNRIANSNNWTSATNVSDNNTEINQSVAPISTLDNVDAQAEKIAEDIKKGIGDSELGGEGASGSGSGTRSPASTGGGGSVGALGGGLSAGMGGKGRLASNWIDKITFDETQFKKIIEDSYFQNESNKEVLLKALGVMGFKVLTIEENKLNSKDIEYIIREYDLELSDNLKKFFGVNDLNSIKNREIVNKKFVEILKDEEKYKEIIAEMMEKFIVKDEKRFSDEGKGLAYKGSVITKNEISESIKKFYAL